MTLMKTITLITVLMISSFTYADSYQKDLDKVVSDMEDFGISVDTFSQNPFQTGTSLSNYYLGEKAILLERDTFFQLKSNQLKSTDDVADYLHRLKILRSQGNNMMLQMMNALENRDKEGHVSVEEPKHKETIEELIASCNQEPKCISDKLNNPETSLYNILIDNFTLSSQIFSEIPYMHTIELTGIYQLIQLIYLEVLVGHAKVANVEFDLFINKEETILNTIKNNHQLTATEKELDKQMVENQIKKWKVEIVERKFDHNDEFVRLANELKNKNIEIALEINELRIGNPKIVSKEKKCGTFLSKSRKERARCKLRKNLMDLIVNVETDQFLTKEEAQLPVSFWTKY